MERVFKTVSLFLSVVFLFVFVFVFVIYEQSNFATEVWKELASGEGSRLEETRTMEKISDELSPHLLLCFLLLSTTFPWFWHFSSVTFSLSSLSLSLSSPLINHISPLFILFLSVSFSLSHFYFLRQLPSIRGKKSRTWTRLATSWSNFPTLDLFSSFTFFFLHFHFHFLLLWSATYPHFLSFFCLSVSLCPFFTFFVNCRAYTWKRWTRWRIPYSVFFSSATFSYTFVFHVSCCKQGNLHYSETGVKV